MPRRVIPSELLDKQGAWPMAEARIIKRYANRKLYDTQHSRYVTLEQISEMIRAGDDVKIVDNKTKEDLTSVTLAQIIFEEEKKQRSFLPLGAMRNIIQNGGEWFAEVQRKVQSILPGKRRDADAPIDPADAETVDEPPPGDNGAQASEPEKDGTAVVRRGREGIAALREWVAQSKIALDDWQRRVDGRIRSAVEGISPFSGLNKDVKALSERIAELEAKLEVLAAQGHEEPH
jgi:polyhydroxyalkanoate synthesis repressor PhaR